MAAIGLCFWFFLGGHHLYMNLCVWVYLCVRLSIPKNVRFSVSLMCISNTFQMESYKHKMVKLLT